MQSGDIILTKVYHACAVLLRPVHRHSTDLSFSSNHLQRLEHLVLHWRPESDKAADVGPASHTKVRRIVGRSPAWCRMAKLLRKTFATDGMTAGSEHTDDALPRM